MARSLLARRVPQLTGIYLVASWGLLEFVDWAVDQYALSPVLTNFVVTLLVLLLPMVVVLAWRHGAPGADRWTRIDGAAIGLNLAAAAGILFVAFSGQELGAATTVKVVEDEAGNTVERVVPKAAFRRNVLLYDFDNESGDPELDWLRTGIVIGVSFDLFQDLFMTCLTVDDAGTVRERLAEAGFDLTDNIPLSLKREAAERRSVGHFMGGAVRTDGDTLVIETRLYETRNARLVATRTYRGTDPLELADRISVDFRRDLGIPDWQIEESVDLPAAELLTHSPDAFRSFSKVLVATRSNDLVAARSLAEEAVARDSTFALAHLWVSIIALLSGDQAAAGTLMAEATRHAYRLPERARLSVQVVDQLYYKQDPEAAIRAARYWTEIYPQDAEARRQLAGIYASTGDMDGQLAQYRALLAIDSADVGTMRQMASVFRAREEYDSAFVYYEHLGDRRPTDIRTRLDIAGTLLSLVKYAEAREELERARVAAPDEPDVLNQLARLDMREGRYEDAARRVEQMTSLGRTPQERHASVGLEETLYYERGQFARLEDAYRRRLATLAEYQSPIDVVGQMDNSELFIYAAEGGREAYALQQIDSLRNSVEAPWNLELELAAVRIHLDLGDVESARESLAGLRTLSEARGSNRGNTAFITWVEGRIAELEDGNCRRALESYDEARDLVPLDWLYHATRLRCLTSLERWSDAEEEVAWLLERAPGRGVYRLDVARYHAARGRTEDAVAELEAAVEIWSEADPDHRPSREARELLRDLRAE
jgi:tetratricopeptide (TPR) repeat protein/TolB-like protein